MGWDDDVTICRVDASVDYPVREPVVHSYHDAAARHYVNAMRASHGGYLPGPRPGSVDHGAAIDLHIFAGAFVVRNNGGDCAGFVVDLGGLVVGQCQRSERTCRFDQPPAHPPTVNGAVFYSERAFDAWVEAWFHA